MADNELFGIYEQLESLCGHEKDHVADPGNMVGDLISRQEALDIYDDYNIAVENGELGAYRKHRKRLLELPSAQPPKEIPKRVLWSGWKGCRDTRYKCPNCEKPVRNDDHYCHRCGQRLMFTHISFTDYVPGEKQDVIVRWDDEG